MILDNWMIGLVVDQMRMDVGVKQSNNCLSGDGRHWIKPME